MIAKIQKLAVVFDYDLTSLERQDGILKRTFDIICAGLALLVLSPVLFLVGMLVRVMLGTPIIFKQPRPGRAGKLFRLLKFRTMTDARDGNGQLLPDKERLTTFGRFLRASSLDELPELLNVLRGDMSLVGPRPLLVEYLPLYTAAQARRHEVRPGITGWAQVNGRNAISWEDKFRLDVWYVDNQSLWLDLKILFMTIAQVFSGSDVNAPGEATMPRFTGTREER
jgi:lipopolysaccharide/colanic/teichoic acid biosynthesis glycosyltransferase